MNPLFIVIAIFGAAALLLVAQPHKLTLRARRSFGGLLRDTLGALPFEQITPEAKIALTEFHEDFLMALSQSDVEPWSAQLGLDKVSDAPRMMFPVPISAAGYQEFTGDMRYREIYEKSITLIPVVWQDGVKILESKISMGDFDGWDLEPERMAMAAISLGNELVAQQLITNPASWETNAGSINFFQSTSTSSPSFSTGSHYYNLLNTALGGFDNDFGTGANTVPSHQNLQLSAQRFRRILAANGRPLGLRLSHILAPPAQEEIWRNILEQAHRVGSLNQPLVNVAGDDSGGTGYAAVENRDYNRVQLIIADELGGNYTSPTTGATGSDTQWYALALNKKGMYPWITHRQATPEVIINDKASDFYKRTLQVSLAHLLRAVGGLALPQCVQRWKGTTS